MVVLLPLPTSAGITCVSMSPYMDGTYAKWKNPVTWSHRPCDFSTGKCREKSAQPFLRARGAGIWEYRGEKGQFLLFWGGTYFIFIYVSMCLCMHTPVWGPEEARGGCQVLWSECCRFKLDNCQPPAKGTGNWTWVLSWVLCKSSECFLTTEPPLRPSHIPSLGDKKKKEEVLKLIVVTVTCLNILKPLNQTLGEEALWEMS